MGPDKAPYLGTFVYGSLPRSTTVRHVLLLLLLLSVETSLVEGDEELD